MECGSVLYNLTNKINVSRKLIQKYDILFLEILLTKSKSVNGLKIAIESEKTHKMSLFTSWKFRSLGNAKFPCSWRNSYWYWKLYTNDIENQWTIIADEHNNFSLTYFLSGQLIPDEHPIEVFLKFLLSRLICLIFLQIWNKMWMPNCYITAM